MHVRIRHLVLPLLFLAACGSTDPGARPAGSSLPEAAPPIALKGSGYETAEIVKLPEAHPDEWEDLHNVIRLSDNIVSGSEPHGEAALARIAGMGVKTIVSVDGKTPDVETAERLGLRYVHVPIQYSGITDTEIADLAKTFRELPGPFYVHCFHGKHRGPAGAAVGRLVLDGAAREQTLAEMRQWCGTSKKYEGLYRDIATKPLPSAEQTAALEFDFPSRHPFQGTRQAMIDMARHWDNAVALGHNDWAVDPKHPDLDPKNETDKVLDLFDALTADAGFTKEPEDYRGWMTSAHGEAKQLVALIGRQRAGDAEAGRQAQETVKRLKTLCDSCHATYRD